MLEHVSMRRLTRRAQLFRQLAGVLEELSKELRSPEDLNGEISEGLPMLGHFAQVAASKAKAHEAEIERRTKSGEK